jgi:hypothetical protein
MVLQSFLLGGAIRWLSRALLLTDVWYNQVVLCHLGFCVLSPGTGVTSIDAGQNERGGVDIL